ncbi:hypothetical protein AKO1_014816 [Acrasis kona]|uniref:UBX domain-containing protein n=1 Tax=Acrasis kona TaxID=1008807 RepID=A0AAW2Z1G4_9EUKA
MYIKLFIKHRGIEKQLEVRPDDTLDDLRVRLYTIFGIPKENQKLLGIKKKQFNSDDTMTTLGFQDGQNLLLIGSTAKQIEEHVLQEQEIQKDMQISALSSPVDEYEQDFEMDDDANYSSDSGQPQDSIMIENSALYELFEQTLKTRYADSNIDKLLFIDKPYDQAFDEAKRSSRILVCVLYSKNDSDSFKYASDILTNDVIMDMINHNFVLWMGDVNNQANTRSFRNMLSRNMEVAHHVTNMQSSILPTTCLLSYFENSVSIIDVLEGVVDLNTLCFDKMLTAIEVHGPLLENKKVVETQIMSVLNQQDERYQESLRKDQEKKRHQDMIEEQERVARSLEESRLEALERSREEKIRTLPAEPPLIKGTFAALRIRLQDGTQLNRRFALTDTIKTLFDYIDVEKGLDCNQVELVCNFPKMSFQYERDGMVSVDKLAPQAQLFIKEK